MLEFTSSSESESDRMTASDFFQMGGYAVYVWTSYGLALIVLLANLLSARKRHREAWRRTLRLSRKGARP